MFTDRRRDVLLMALLVSTPIVLVIFFRFISEPGIVEYGDLLWPQYDQQGLVGLYMDTFQTGMLPNQMIIYSWLYYLPLGSAGLERLLYLATYLAIGSIAYYVTYRVLRHEGVTTRLAYIISGVAAVANIVNPLMFYYNPHLFILLGFALFPAVIYITLKFLWSDQQKLDWIKCGLMLGVLIALSAGDPRWPIWDFFAICIITGVFFITGRFRGAVRITGMLFVSVLSFLGLSAFWIVPIIIGNSSDATLLVRPDLSVAFYYVLNRYTTLFNSLILQADFWTPSRVMFEPSGEIQNVVWRASQLVLPVVGLLSAFMIYLNRKWNRTIIALLVLAGVTLIVASAPKSPFPFVDAFYQWAVFSLPNGVAFRTSYKWLLIYVFPITLLASIALSKLSILFLNGSKYRRAALGPKAKRVRKVLVGFILLLFLSATLVASSPMVTGDFNGQFVPYEMSLDYRNAYSIIETQSNSDYSYKILYLPSNTYHGFPAPGVLDSAFLRYIMLSLEDGSIDNVGKCLNLINVKYIIYDKYKYSDKLIEENLRGQGDLTLEYEGDQLLVFRSSGFSKAIDYSEYAINFNGVDAVALSDLGMNWIQADQGVLDLDDAFALSSHVIMGPDYPYALIASHSSLSFPYQYTVESDKTVTWTSLSAYSSGSVEWPNILLDQGTVNWQLDYSRGITYTKVNRTLPDALKPTASDLIYNWDFNQASTVDQWAEINGKTQFGTKQTLSQDGDALKVSLAAATSGWKTVSSPMIEVDSLGAYSFSFEIKSKSGYEVHIKVAEYDENGTWLSGKRIAGVGSGEFDWKALNFYYLPTNSETKYIKLQIWHGNEPDTSLPNQFWVRDIVVNNLTRYVVAPAIEGKIVAETDGVYLLSSRLFTNTQGGEVIVSIDGETRTLSTASPSNSFVWMDLGTFYLQAGSHTIKVINSNGFNAINLFSLIDVNEYNQLKAMYDSQLAEKTIIYSLNGNTFENTSASYPDRIDLVSGAVGNDSNAYQMIEIAQSGEYDIRIEVDGDVTLWLDGTQIVANAVNVTTIESVYLDKGPHLLEIRSNIPTTERTFVVGQNAGDLKLSKRYTVSPPISVASQKAYTVSLSSVAQIKNCTVQVVEYNKTGVLVAKSTYKLNEEAGNDSPKIMFVTTDSTSYLNITGICGNPKNYIDEIDVDEISVSWLRGVRLVSASSGPEPSGELETSSVGQIIDVVKISPSEYRVNLRTNGSGVLTLSNRFENSWVVIAQGDENPKGSLPINTGMNGFILSGGEEYNITVVYSLDQPYHTGAMITLVSIVVVGIMAIVVYRPDLLTGVARRLRRLF